MNQAFASLFISLVFYLADLAFSQDDPSACVVINEIVHRPLPGEEDWIELLNTCDSEVDLAGYYVRDSNLESLYMLGNEAAGCEHKILPRSYLLLFRNAVCSFEFGLGDDDMVYLYDPDMNEVQSVVWTRYDARQGKSWARLPSGTGSFVTTDPTPGEWNGNSLQVPPKVVTTVEEVTVIINELVNSPQSEEERDWIELYNYGTAPVDLTGLRLTDEGSNPGSGFYFGQPGCESDTVIQPGEYKVLDRDAECSFDFGFGDNDQAMLWFDLETTVDSTAFGPKFSTSLVPSGVSWGRLPDGSKSASFTTLVPTKGAANGDEITGDDLLLKIAADAIADKS
eukprot:TRINITY_DN17583_c0_g1_i1.p2 TRINITY_DN17583_c0_g1~~TRINITY_DN17583_c0_g1_i1.p2  ORF type:complete len:367 (-),score=57.17 TRINITY_DN17583_c0_g1_i1:437-1453(-)